MTAYKNFEKSLNKHFGDMSIFDVSNVIFPLFKITQIVFFGCDAQISVDELNFFGENNLK